MRDTNKTHFSGSGDRAVEGKSKIPPKQSAVGQAGASGERIFTVEQLAKMFNVSSKTISRWRNIGLEGRLLDFGGRKQLGFLRDSVDQFVRENPQRVKRGSSFSQMTDQERAALVEDAQSLTQAGCQPTEIVKRLAKRTGRSEETIRYTIKRHDQQHPSAAIFKASATTQPDELASTMYEQYLAGMDVDALSKRFRRSKAAVRKMLSRMRAARILELQLDYMPSPEFDRASAEKCITGPLPESKSATRKSQPPAELPAYLAGLYDTPLLTAAQEVHLFRKYNYLKYCASKLRETLSLTKPNRKVLDKIERHYDEAVTTKNQIIQANLRLVVSILKRYTHSAEGLFERVSEGNISLIRAVEKFDYTRGFKFSTYATWAIKKNYARTSATELKQRERFQPAGEYPMFDRVDERANPFKREAAQRRSESAVKRILGCLNERERRIINERFGLCGRDDGSTLKEVGVGLGVSKERVRQIESRALAKLRAAAEGEKIELPEDSMGN